MLNALLTCLPETAMVAGNLVVFPSNKALSLRAHGMAETTLRRHLGALVQAGLVVRRDSPNGKRYALRGGEGVEQAYGLDLSPVLARAEEFEHLAAEAAAERRASALARGRVTIYRRDIAKMIEAGAAAGAVWQSYREAFAPLCFRLPRRVTAASLAPLLADLHSLASELGEPWKDCSKHRIWTAMPANPACISRIQNQKVLLLLNPLPRIRVRVGQFAICHWLWLNQPVLTSSCTIAAASRLGAT